MFVPVIGADNRPLMPTTPSRARRWIKSGEATPFFRRGIFAVRLNRPASNNLVQQVAVGIDPGSKREGFSVKAAAHTYLNIQADAVTWVNEAVQRRKAMRRGRRLRNTPCRANRPHRKVGGVPPSVRARWGWKLRLAAWIASLFPVSRFVVEDVGATKRKGARAWNASFGPLEVGKTTFYQSLGQIAPVQIVRGWDTKAMREAAGLTKSRTKLAETFAAHCVDSWVLAHSSVGGSSVPDNTRILIVTPIRLFRRQLHMTQPTTGGHRRTLGGTRTLGFKRGSYVSHPDHGVLYVGGHWGKLISLHSTTTGQRVLRTSKLSALKFRCYASWRCRSPK